MAQFAGSNRTELSYEVETVFGTDPASGTRQGLRYTGESITHTINTNVPNEIRADGMSPKQTQQSAETAGNLDILWSYNSYNDFIQGAMRSTFSTPIAVAAADIDAAVTGTAIVLTSVGTAIETGVSVGQWLEVRGFATVGNNGYFKVTATGVNSITLNDHIGSAVTEAAGAAVTIGGSIIRNGTTLSSYTIQEDYLDALTPTRFVHSGMRVGSMSLAAAVGSDLSGAFTFMGLTTTSTATLTGTTTAPLTTDVLNSVSNIGDIVIDNATTGVSFQSINIDVNSNLRGQDAIGTLGHVGVALGTFSISGSINLYFADAAEFDKFRANTSFSLSFRSEDAAGNAYIFTIPNAQYSSMDVNSTGLDTDIVSAANFTASIDPATNCMFQIDKFAA